MNLTVEAKICTSTPSSVSFNQRKIVRDPIQYTAGRCLNALILVANGGKN